MCTLGPKCAVVIFVICFSAVVQSADRNFKIDFDGNTFLKDGKPFRYVSGSIHYSRVHHYYWKDRLLKMYAAGLNAIQLYVPWNVHEPAPGIYDFEGQQDLEGFLRMANDTGLVVLLRAGPYICGEWEFGGFPAWILKNSPNTTFRTMDPQYIEPVDRWLTVLFTKIYPLLYNNGGPVIMVQIENEYGSYFACDFDYLRYLRKKATVILGSDVVLFTTDGGASSYLRCGTLEDVYSTVDFGITRDPAVAFEAQREWQPKGPLVNSEYYLGWLDHWGQNHSVVDTDEVAISLDLLLAYGANINMYMFEGGTNFGFWNGANFSPYQPVPTSYDYDSPMSEAGDITDKFYTLRQVISKYHPLPNMSIPLSTPKFAYNSINMSFLLTIQDALQTLCPSGPAKSVYPLSMEDLGHYYGFVLYRTVLKQNLTKPTLLMAQGIRDRGVVMVDGLPQGILIRGTPALEMNVTGIQGQNLDILVENQGRIGYGTGINFNRKGLIENVTIGGDIVQDWLMFPLDLNNIKPEHMALQYNRFRTLPRLGAGLMTPSIYMGELKIPAVSTQPQDTYVDPSLWTKGQMFVNGFNLGRYWPAAGPQIRLYLPKPVLTPGVNHIMMLELENAPSSCQAGQPPCLLKFNDQPFLNATVPKGRQQLSGKIRTSHSQSISEDYDWHKYH